MLNFYVKIRRKKSQIPPMKVAAHHNYNTSALIFFLWIFEWIEKEVSFSASFGLRNFFISLSWFKLGHLVISLQKYFLYSVCTSFVFRTWSKVILIYSPIKIVFPLKKTYNFSIDQRNEYSHILLKSKIKSFHKNRSKLAQKKSKCISFFYLENFGINKQKYCFKMKKKKKYLNEKLKEEKKNVWASSQKRVTNMRL